MGNVIELTPEVEMSPWGNDNITLTLNEIAGLMKDKKYYYFDGEYGHVIEADINFDE